MKLTKVPLLTSAISFRRLKSYYTAARERQPSGNLGVWAKDTGKDMGYWTDSKITGIAGGLPIIIDGKVVGGIGISGLAESDDEQIAKSVL